MVIGVCGFGYSGSGAVWDMLKESPDCKTIGGEKEFTFLYAPDGLDDLRYHLIQQPARFMACDIAINRFISFIQEFDSDGWDKVFFNNLNEYCMDFLEKIVQVEWDGYWDWDIKKTKSNPITYCKYRLRRKYNSYAKKHGKKEIPLVKSRKMYLSINPKEFDDYAKELLRKLLNTSLNDTKKNIVAINQVFPANNTDHFLNYFDDAKAILVVRDPRDVYISLKMIQDIGSKWFPHDDVDKFIEYYRILHNQVKETEQIIVVRFEDLIYHYEDSRRRIYEFCGLSLDEKEAGKFFSPDISKRNTMLYLDHDELKNDIEKIQNELKEFIYAFDEKIIISHKGAF